MRSFSYELRDMSGLTSSGVIEASSEKEAAEIVRTQGELLSISSTGWRVGRSLDRLRKARIDSGPSQRDVFMFTSQLAVMAKAGVNIRDALHSMVEQMPECKFRSIVDEITSEVEGGQPFSAALAAYPKLFSPLVIHMIRAAELSGTMGQMLDRIAGYLEQQLETRGMVRGAMAYPAIIFCMAIGATTFLMTFALPKFTTMFAGKSALLPTPTVILLAVSNVLRVYWYAVLGGAVGAVAGFRWLIKSRWGRPRWDALKLRLPVFKPMLHALYITQSLRALGELVSAGTQVLDAISIAADISANTVYKRMWQSVQAQVKEGNKIADSLRGQSLLPTSVIQMIAAGEESGSLAKVCEHISDFYAKELRRRIKMATTLIEPVMIIAMGLVVGFIAMSVILPIFKMSSLLK